MARMYPPELPDGEATRSEQHVFAALRDGLAEEWEAFHSVSWMTRDHVEGALDGEIDFVLCHPQRAIVALEVKGKGIECINGAWFRLAPNGERTAIKDPFKQALDHRYNLQRKIDEVDGWRGKDLLIAH